jgi:hypothetical protein
VITLQAEPITGSYFVGWKQGEQIVSEEPMLTFTVKGNITYEAVFESVNYIEVTLDEDAIDNTSVFDNPHGKYFMVSMNRLLTPNIWNPFCVPFNISEQQINKTWGYATKVIEFYAMDGDVTLFKYCSDIKAGVPYLVMPEREVTTPHFDYDENIVVCKQPIGVDIDGVTIWGNYSPYAWNASADLEEYYFDGESNVYIMASGPNKTRRQKGMLKGFRFYATVPKGKKLICMCIGDDVVGLDKQIADISLRPMTIQIYNLQGQYLGTRTDKLPAGFYIINGKKCVIR